MAGELKGAFVYSKTANGNYNFRLKASNRETIAISEGVTSDLAGCKRGIESVRRFCNIDKIEDQTLARGYETLTNPKYEIYLDRQGKYRYRLKANNGNILCISEEGYSSRATCRAGIASVGRWAPDAEVISDTDYKR